jgi:O-methyltransferase
MRHLEMPNRVTPTLASFVARAVKRIGYYTPFQRALFHRYDYMFTPGQLMFLCECLRETQSLDGPVLEIGCAGGSTTVFLCRYLDELASSRRYLCLDTFTGFTADDIAVERSRGKTAPYEAIFKAYSPEYFARTLRNNAISRPEVVQVDINEFDFSTVENVSFCLIDVDLYRPVRRALEGVLPQMASGGIVVVDDCLDDNEYDGAYHAFAELVRERGLTSSVRCKKLGYLPVP